MSQKLIHFEKSINGNLQVQMCQLNKLTSKSLIVLERRYSTCREKQSLLLLPQRIPCANHSRCSLQNSFNVKGVAYCNVGLLRGKMAGVPNMESLSGLACVHESLRSIVEPKNKPETRSAHMGLVL